MAVKATNYQCPSCGAEIICDHTTAATKVALKKHYKGKKFLPKTFSVDNKIEELKGIYVPFWLLDGVSDGDIRYRGTTNHSYTQGMIK